MKKILIFVWEIAKIVLISLVIIVPIRYFLIQPFFVKGASMEPSFNSGQYLIIDEISYRFSEPERGDAIVFKYPMDTSQYYIKRIVGLPKETVEVSGGKVVIYKDDSDQGMVLDESLYVSEGTFTYGEIRIELGSEEYFVLGDNRQASSDSRHWGALVDEYIIGRVWIRAWPFNVMTMY